MECFSRGKLTIVQLLVAGYSERCMKVVSTAFMKGEAQ